MVILPKEAHGYAAKENILHLLCGTRSILQKYLRINTKDPKLIRGLFLSYHQSYFLIQL
jgi:hypothetical protein